jgi:hypothetical protein
MMQTRFGIPRSATSHSAPAGSKPASSKKRNVSLNPHRILHRASSSISQFQDIAILRIRSLPALILGVAVAWSAHPAPAQGGPPFITDDPAPPGNRHWEINFGWIADHNPGNAYYQTPDVDMNYGWGDRIQLKYELPMAVATDSNNTTRAGLGESLLGIKYRAWQHYQPGKPKDDDHIDFSIGTYPQASINNPTSAVRRGIVENGPQYYLPLEATAQIGPVALDGEVGHWFGNQLIPSRWGRGLIAGHAFSERFELYSEIYDLQDANRIGLVPKQRELTVDFGGRQTLDKGGHFRLLFMGGRAIQAVTRQNSEPNWIAYLGIQMLLGPKEPEEPEKAPETPAAKQ